MESLIRYFLGTLMILSLVLGGIFMIIPTFMDQLTALGFSPEEMRIWVYRVVVPTYFFTIAYTSIGFNWSIWLFQSSPFLFSVRHIIAERAIFLAAVCN